MADLDHLPYLKRVALNDVDFVTEREQTYRGSWKESGGRSAWFMLRRKMDRLINLLARPEEPANFTMDEAALIDDFKGEYPDSLAHLIKSYQSEDIFAKIKAEPSGNDGTVLAEIRDLRRYLLLVEAEMVAKGVVDAL